MITTIELPPSKLTKHQKKTFGPKRIAGYGPDALITATVRHDDECGNGHNTFSITAEVVTPASKRRNDIEAGGCMHEEIAKAFPELAPFIKWHLTSTDGPMHYVANTVYHATEHGPTHAWVYFDDPENGIKKQCVKYCKLAEAESMCAIPSKQFNYVSGVGYRLEKDQKTAKQANLEFARSSAIWPEATREQLLDEKALLARLPALMEAFKRDVESLGFIY